MKLTGILLLISALVALGSPQISSAQTGEPIVCEPVEQSTETVTGGVTVTWDSSLLCLEPPQNGIYAATVTIAVDPASISGLSVEHIRLLLTTPRPGGSGPDASVGSSDLPVSIDSGGQVTTTIEGDFELATTDEGARATLHLQFEGFVSHAGDRFSLAINIHFGTLDDDNGGPPNSDSDGDEDNGEGPPEWAGGPPAWAPGPPPWASDRQSFLEHIRNSTA